MENVPTLPSCACKLVLFISLLIWNFMVFMGLERLIYTHLRELQSALPFFFSPELFIGGPRKYILFFCPLQGRVGVGWDYSFCSLQGWGGIKNDVAHWYSFIARGIVRSKKISSSQEIMWLRLILQKTNHENNAIQCSCLHSIFVTMFGLILLAGWR